jgi:predicted enzyme related to lactoylglutathione lyase
MAGIVWWEIESRDPESCQRFHHALSGWEFVSAFRDSDLGAEYWIIQADGQGIGGLQRAETTAPTPAVGTRIYLEVADLEASLDQIATLGGFVERERTALGGDDRWFATFVDPTGISFGLWTANQPTDDTT